MSHSEVHHRKEDGGIWAGLFSQGVGGGHPAELHKPPAPRTHGQDECSEGGGGEQTCALGSRATAVLTAETAMGYGRQCSLQRINPWAVGRAPRGSKGWGK